MKGPNRPLDELLREYELGQLDEGARAFVEASLARSAPLREQQAVLRDAFDGLDQWSVPAAPAYLPNRVLSAVASATAAEPSLPFPDEAASSLPAGPGGGMSGGTILTVRELVAIAACITLFVGIFVPAGVKARNVAWRTQCKQNLRTFMTGLASYAADARGELAFAGTIPGASWQRGPRGVRRVSNTKHPYLVVKLRYVRSPKVFICPTQKQARPMIADDYAQFDDVAERANFTYSYQNMGGPARPKWEEDPNMVIMADASPLFGRPTHQVTAYPHANSADHDREDGQNILTASGAVRWVNTPTVGVNGDNIWTPSGWTPSGHRDLTNLAYAVPASATDSFLINRP